MDTAALFETPDSQELPMLEYMERLFAEGRYYETFVFSQNAIRQNPNSAHLSLFRSCSFIMLAADEQIEYQESLLSDVLEQLALVCELLELNRRPDEPLLFYRALGLFVLGRFNEADRLWQTIPEASRAYVADAFLSYRAHWMERWPNYQDLPENLPPS